MKQDCDCRYVIFDGIVYDNNPQEDCKMCNGRGWYKNTIEQSVKKMLRRKFK